MKNIIIPSADNLISLPGHKTVLAESDISQLLDELGRLINEKAPKVFGGKMILPREKYILGKEILSVLESIGKIPGYSQISSHLREIFITANSWTDFDPNAKIAIDRDASFEDLELMKSHYDEIMQNRI